jgi:hypothetical protein
MTISFILRPLEIFHGLLVYLVVIGYNFPRFGILDQEKSGNPAEQANEASSIDSGLKKKAILNLIQTINRFFCLFCFYYKQGGQIVL